MQNLLPFFSINSVVGILCGCFLMYHQATRLYINESVDNYALPLQAVSTLQTGNGDTETVKVLFTVQISVQLFLVLLQTSCTNNYPTIFVFYFILSREVNYSGKIFFLQVYQDVLIFDYHGYTLKIMLRNLAKWGVQTNLRHSRPQ